MTETGIIHIFSAIYLSGIISLAVSLNENRAPRRIVRETLRRWVKFVGIGVLLAIVLNVVIMIFT